MAYFPRVVSGNLAYLRCGAGAVALAFCVGEAPSSRLQRPTQPTLCDRGVQKTRSRRRDQKKPAANVPTREEIEMSFLSACRHELKPAHTQKPEDKEYCKDLLANNKEALRAEQQAWIKALLEEESYLDFIQKEIAKARSVTSSNFEYPICEKGSNRPMQVFAFLQPVEDDPDIGKTGKYILRISTDGLDVPAGFRRWKWTQATVYELPTWSKYDASVNPKDVPKIGKVEDCYLTFEHRRFLRLFQLMLDDSIEEMQIEFRLLSPAVLLKRCQDQREYFDRDFPPLGSTRLPLVNVTGSTWMQKHNEVFIPKLAATNPCAVVYNFWEFKPGYDAMKPAFQQAKYSFTNKEYR